MQALRRLLLKLVGGLLIDEVGESRREIRRMETDLVDAKSKLLAATDDLASYKRAVEEKDAEIRVLKAENEMLWKLDQRNIARIDMERAQAHRAIAEAEVARVSRVSEQDME